MPNQTTFINGFQKGSSENANIGFGTFVGVETYSKKGVAQLTKDTVKVSGSVVVDLPVYFTAIDTLTLFAQGHLSHVYKSTDGGSTWTDISSAGAIGDLGGGIMNFQGYIFAWHGSKIDYLSSPYGSGDWTSNWKTGLIGNTGHFPFFFPNDNNIYFGNRNKVGKIGFGTASTFNPGGSSGTDYFYSASAGNPNGLLPEFYQITCISFLPTNFLALGTTSDINSAVSDIILWNPTLSTYETPLRLYSQAQSGENGVKQLINRNNVLYAVVGGSHTIFSTNGTSFRQVADISLYSNIRKVTGMQAQVPVFIRPYPGAIDVFGNKLLTGISTPSSIAYYPTGYGLYPCGVWSVAFTDEGEAIQCEYTISTGTVVAVNKVFYIGAIKCLNANQTLIGWRDDSTYGIDLVSTTNFQNDSSVTAIESQMMEIGTPLDPAAVPNIQINVTRTLLAGQEATLTYRTGYDQDFQDMQTFTVTDGNSLKVTQNTIDTAKFLQLRLQMKAGSDATYSPEIRTIIVDK